MRVLNCIFVLFLHLNSLQLSASILNEYRLPTSIHPIHYNITLVPNFTNLTFIGNEDILINISANHFNTTDTNASDNFLLQIHTGPQMTITNISLSIVNKHFITNQSYNNETQIMTFEFDVSSNEIMDAIISNGGLYVLSVIHITFNGLLREDMKGFYISQYTYENTTIYNAVTQFESTDARRAFPCFDEPSFKAQFTITLITPSICTVLSNMNVLQTTIMDNTNECQYIAPLSMGGVSTECKRVQFAPSPPMSTYLIAFAVGLYDNVTDYTVNGLKTSIYFPMDSDANHAVYALNAALKILPLYEELFGVAFPLPKMDCIALSDFSAGAMENWGLVTYRRTALLVDPETSSESSLRRVVVVIAHEFAHQWFGNIVTMKWWDDLWLNEGFASFVEHIGTNYSSPEFEIWNFFLIHMNSVLFTDSSYYTHSIESTVNDPNEIDTLFDSVTYDKGMSVIRMLYQYMGSEPFMNGIQSYLTTHIYDNADTQQLWNALGGDDIVNMMNSWVLQPGFPVLNVSMKANNDYGVIFEVEQHRMMKKGPSNLDDEYTLKYDTDLLNEYNDQLWMIPLQIESVDGTVPLNDKVMTRRFMTINISRLREDVDEFYLFNKDMIGFYRVLYDEDSFNLITDEWLNGNHLSEFDKFSLLSDEYAFMRSNYISATHYLEFLRKISDKEAISPSFLLWNTMITSLLDIDSLFCEGHLQQNNDVLTQFRFHALAIISPVWSAINKWNIDESDSENIINLRGLLIYALIRFNDEDTIDYGYNMLKNIMVNDKIPVNDEGDIEGIDTNILKTVIECALTHDANNDGKEDILNAFTSIYSDLSSEYQGYVLRAIGAVYMNNALSVNALDFILESGSVRDQDKLRALYSLRRCYGRENVWQYLTQNEYWESLFDIYGSGFSAQDLTEIANTFASISYYWNVYDFYYKENGHKTSSNERSVNQTLENIQINTEWIQYNYDDLREYLSIAISTTNIPIITRPQIYHHINSTTTIAHRQHFMMIYLWIALGMLFVLLFCVFGLRWIWKRKSIKGRMSAYQRQIDDHNNTNTMANNVNNNKYAVTINSIDDDQFDEDDDRL